MLPFFWRVSIGLCCTRAFHWVNVILICPRWSKSHDFLFVLRCDFVQVWVWPGSLLQSILSERLQLKCDLFVWKNQNLVYRKCMKYYRLTGISELVRLTVAAWGWGDGAKAALLLFDIVVVVALGDADGTAAVEANAAAAILAIDCFFVFSVRQCLSYRIPNRTIKYSISARNTNNMHDISHTCNIRPL